MWLMQKRILTIILYFLIIMNNSTEISTKTVKRRGIMDNLKYAGQMFGIKTASDVANLISKAFSTNEQTPVENPFNPMGFISGILRLMSFDKRKLSALAINGIIFIAQLIGNTLMNERRPLPIFEPNYGNNQRFKEDHSDDLNEINYSKGRSARQGSPLNWILENTSDDLKQFLNGMQDKKLPEYLTEIVEKLEKEKGEGDCIKQLLCKSAPFIWSMQKSVLERINNTEYNETNETNRNYLKVFFKYLPDVNTFKHHGLLCEEKYSKCNTLYI